MSAEVLLKRAQRQLSKWQDFYGRLGPVQLPPAGNVELAEDIDEYLAMKEKKP